MIQLRKLLLASGLEEELKWGKPCYCSQGKNIAILQPFKAHLSLMFFKGALLEDSQGILRSQGANTQAARRIEVTSRAEVTRIAGALKGYFEQAIALEKAGSRVQAKPVSEQEHPPELLKRLAADEAYRNAFAALTPGRRRSYLLHFSGAKQAATRETRIEKCRAKVLLGKGFIER